MTADGLARAHAGDADHLTVMTESSTIFTCCVARATCRAPSVSSLHGETHFTAFECGVILRSVASFCVIICVCLSCLCCILSKALTVDLGILKTYFRAKKMKFLSHACISRSSDPGQGHRSKDVI